MDTQMMELLTRLGWTSVQSAVLVALVWGVCRLLPRLPAATRCRLWWLVAVQAVLGLVWSSPLELAVLPAPGIDTATLAAQPMLPVQRVLSGAAVDVPLPAVTASLLPDLSWQTALFALWAAGVLVMLLHSLRAYRQSRALVRSAARCTDAGLQQALQLAAEAHGLARAPQLKISAQITSPQLIGPWNPVLLLPARELPAMAADDLDMALTHELVHLQRRDLWWGLLPSLAQHLLFFHPLVHLAAREYALAREEACDSAVVAGHGHCRHDYGRLLVQLGVAPRPAVGVASASPNFRSLKRRLLTLQQTGSLPRVVSVGVTAVFVLVGVAPLRLVAAVPPAPPEPPALVAAPAMPAVPAAPAAPPALAAPKPAPAPRPASAPRPPAAPAAPTAPPHPDEASTLQVNSSGTSTTLVTHGRLDLSHQPSQAYVLRMGGDNFVDASMDDLKQSQRDTRSGEPALWVRRGNDRYVIRDPAVIRSLGQSQKEIAELGRAQGELGEQQGRLGEQQGRLGERISTIAQQASRDAIDASREAMAMDAAEMANQAAGSERGSASAAVAARRASAQARQQAAQARDDHTRQQQIEQAAQQQSQLALQQQGLARQQEALAARQSVASAKVAREVRTVIDQALANGTAQRVR
ncbi:M56 family metallopeptidase [Stenotrophomonas sp. ISL-67]|uniref:M56 family metallopeptidase n=1 Tax=Stenotrophomonas sp. ISL-67 TaxID=2819171 RepID=UPI001BED2FF6|nr:M56 family metallopeptidase [Stenotrophomonas sp. ISL-67]MBT2767221.1 M56 family metallopeptidase [Stenotrophomonas sp. ISL-67]